MSSFGYFVGESASLPPSGSLYPSPAPWRPPSSIPQPPPIVRANSLSELWKYVHPGTQTSLSSIQGGSNLPASFHPSTPALPTSPAPRNGWRASRRRPEAERLVAHLQVILSSPSRAPSEWQNGRLAQCPPRRRLQLGRVGEGRPSIQEGARIKRHGKLKDASSGSHDEIL